MLCYKDRTFCPFYETCKYGNDCETALTPEIEKAADRWWGKEEGGAPISQYMEAPTCFEEKEVKE